MYILTFEKTKSKYFNQALSMALDMGGDYDGQVVTLKYKVSDLLYLYERLFPLLGIIQYWTTAKATFRGKKVHPYRFIFLIWKNVRECSVACGNTMNKRYCWFATDSPGWGCKHLNRIFRDPQGPGNYKTSNKYWYNFGQFEKGEWTINKNYLLERLLLEAEEKALDTCPYFDIEKVKKAVQDLPFSVEIDNLHFKKFYISEYENGLKVEKAVNIRHVKIDTRPPDIRKLLADHDNLFRNISVN